jgi:hypothetical protein
MGTVPVLARGWTVEVNDGDGYDEVKGLEVISFNPGDVKEADTYTKESAGNDEHLVVRRTRTLKLDGRWLEDEGTGARDAGQSSIEALGALTGAGSVASFKTTSPGGKISEFDGTVRMGDLIGNVDEAAKWSATIKVTGAISES